MSQVLQKSAKTWKSQGFFTQGIFLAKHTIQGSYYVLGVYMFTLFDTWYGFGVLNFMVSQFMFFFHFGFLSSFPAKTTIMFPSHMFIISHTSHFLLFIQHIKKN